MQNTKYKVQSTTYKVHSTKCKVQSTKYKVLSTKYKVLVQSNKLSRSKRTVKHVITNAAKMLLVKSKKLLMVTSCCLSNYCFCIWSCARDFVYPPTHSLTHSTPSTHSPTRSTHTTHSLTHSTHSAVEVQSFQVSWHQSIEAWPIQGGQKTKLASIDWGNNRAKLSFAVLGAQCVEWMIAPVMVERPWCLSASGVRCQLLLVLVAHYWYCWHCASCASGTTSASSTAGATSTTCTTSKY